MHYGIAINGSYTVEIFANTAGGMKRGASYDGLFYSQIDADLERMIGWQDARFHAFILQGQGPSMSQGCVGNLLDVSGTITEPPATRLYELWLQQKPFGGALSIRARIEGADSEFILSPTASLFLNSTFPWPDWMAVDLPGSGPVYPLSAPFVRAMLYRARTGGTLSALARLGGGSPDDRNLISFEGDAGLSYKGLIPARADETSGIAFGMARIGMNARGLDQDFRFFSGNPSYPVRDYEAVLEVTYRAQVTPWMTQQPDVQYVFHPDGHVQNADGSIRRDTLVIGLHSVLNV